MSYNLLRSRKHGRPIFLKANIDCLAAKKNKEKESLVIVYHKSYTEIHFPSIVHMNVRVQRRRRAVKDTR